MIGKLAEIAPLATWGLTLAAAALLLCGFVAYGHAKVVSQAYGERFQGGLAPSVLETMMRWSAVCLVGGVLLWGVSLHWPASVLAALGGVVVVVLLLEVVARVRG